MIEDSQELVALLEGTALAGRAIKIIDMERWGETMFAVDLVDGEVNAAWSVARGLLPTTGRWPVGVNSYLDGRVSDHPYPGPFPVHQVSERDRDEAIGLGRVALAELRQARQRAWGPHLTRETIDLHLAETRRRFGDAPRHAEARRALAAEASELDFEHWLLDWEEQRAPTTSPRRGEHLKWFEDNGWMMFCPTTSGAETLAFFEFWSEEGVPGASTERLIAIIDLWQRCYGAELVSNWGTMLQFQVAGPPTTIKDAWDVAVMHDLVAPDTLSLPGVSVREHARALLNRESWFLHERP